MARILLVEDDGLLRESLKLSLSQAGHVVATAQNGAVALSMLGSASFEVIVTDVLMPETDGLEMIMQVRKASQDVKIIAISGGGRAKNLDVLNFASAFGADMIVSKPFTPKQLVEAIERVRSGQR
jgi:DNA-binding response OmpR family regulator